MRTISAFDWLADIDAVEMSPLFVSVFIENEQHNNIPREAIGLIGGCSTHIYIAQIA